MGNVPGKEDVDTYSEPSRTSKMELFAKIVKGFLPLTTFAKTSILDVPLGSEYASRMFNLSWRKSFQIGLMAKSSTRLNCQMVCVHEECK